MKKIIVFVIYISLILFSFNCKTNNEINLINQLQAEETAGIAASTVSSLITSVYQSSISLSYEDRNNLTGLTKGIDLNANYNAVTGWWTISFIYNEYQATLEIQFQDGSGAFHKNFNSITSKILATGYGSGPELTFTIDWVISGLDDQSNSYIINGSGIMEYKGESVSLTLTEVEIKKEGISNPSSGTLTIEVGGISFVLNYDGNAIITVSYSYNGEDYKIIINIYTGAITRLS